MINNQSRSTCIHLQLSTWWTFSYPFSYFLKVQLKLQINTDAFMDVYFINYSCLIKSTPVEGFSGFRGEKVSAILRLMNVQSVEQNDLTQN